MGGKHAKTSPGQGDLFAAGELFPVRAPRTGPRATDLSLRVKTAMGQAIKDCPESVPIVAARIAELTGRELTADALYAYTAPSKPEHQIDITRFCAFVRATGATWLWDVLVEDDGLIVIAGEDAHFAQLGVLRQRRAQIDDVIRQIERDLKQRPSPAPRPRPGGRA